jgi:hypothetical protein
MKGTCVASAYAKAFGLLVQLVFFSQIHRWICVKFELVLT